MPTVIPYIPQSITIHLGIPGSNDANVTVSFPDYIKNVASSEIYPTWNKNALQSNILAQISFALNRVYTEYYRSRKYNFDITSSPAYDQAYVPGRDIFENISQIVDELFNDYIRRQGFVEPLLASYCNGTTSTCKGLSQWGSQDLAQRGKSTIQILKNYYGDNIELVLDAPIQNIINSYPGTPLRQGSSGVNVVVIQTSLNRISQNYPAIPKVIPVDGLFGPITAAAVRKFQEVFGLTVDGIVGKATWYQLVRLYVAILRLAELNSLGQIFTGISWEAPGVNVQSLNELLSMGQSLNNIIQSSSNEIVEGDTGVKVSHLQFMLEILSLFNPRIPPVDITGVFDEITKNAILSFQRLIGVPETGRVDAFTWNAIYNAYAGAALTILNRVELFPYQNATSNIALESYLQFSKPYQFTVTENLFSETSRFTQYPGRNLYYGISDHERRQNNE